MSDNYSWDDFKAEQRSLQRSEATTCPYCYASKVDGVCPNGCDEIKVDDLDLNMADEQSDLDQNNPVDMSPESLDEFYASLGDSFEDYLDHDQSMNY